MSKESDEWIVTWPDGSSGLFCRANEVSFNSDGTVSFCNRGWSEHGFPTQVFVAALAPGAWRAIKREDAKG